MSIYPLIYRNIIFPAYHALKGDSINAALAATRSYDRLSSPAQGARQRAKLKSLLEFVALNNPYYSGVIDHVDDDVESVLQSIPALSKKIIRDQGDLMITPEAIRPCRLIRNSTGGSTGETLKFCNDSGSRNHGAAVTFHEYERLGVGLGERIAQLWGAPMDIGRSSSLRGYFHALLTRRLFMSTYTMSEVDMESYYSSITRFRPVMMISYPSPMTLFCEYLEAGSRKLPRMKAIVVSAETIYPWQREVIERVTETPVYNRYGSREFGNMAIEVPGSDSMKVETDRVIIELLDENMRPVPPGDPGNIHVTDLDNYGMPFIRYNIGDSAIGKMVSDWTGIGWSSLQSVEGRSFDIVKAPNGNRLGGTFWTLMLREKPGMKQFQVLQRNEQSLLIRYVLDEGLSVLPEKSVDFWNTLIRQSCGEDVDITYEPVDSIEKTASGKLRIVISEV